MHPTDENYPEPRWTRADESRFAAALMFAGAEPNLDSDPEGHLEWQQAICHVLLQKYANEWWYNHEDMLWDMLVESDKYRMALEHARAARRHELRTFYTWVCKSRGDSWDERLANPVLAFM